MMHCFVDTYLVCVRTLVRVQLTRDSVGLLEARLTLLTMRRVGSGKQASMI
jgi:hypothetical protein